MENDRKKILIVDTDARFVKNLTHFLSSFDIVVETAADGLDALDRLRENFHAVICEIVIPKIDGLKLTTRIRAQLPDLPIIVVSGIYKGQAIRHKAVHDCKASAFLEKPFPLEEVWKALELVAGFKAPEEGDMTRVAPVAEPSPWTPSSATSWTRSTKTFRILYWTNNPPLRTTRPQWHPRPPLRPLPALRSPRRNPRLLARSPTRSPCPPRSPRSPQDRHPPFLLRRSPRPRRRREGTSNTTT